jgi:hypothetical protein
MRGIIADASFAALAPFLSSVDNLGGARQRI